MVDGSEQVSNLKTEILCSRGLIERNKAKVHTRIQSDRLNTIINKLSNSFLQIHIFAWHEGTLPPT